MPDSAEEESPILDKLRQHLERANTFLEKGDVKIGQVKVVSRVVRNQLRKLYGSESGTVNSWSPENVPEGIDMTQELTRRTQILRAFIRTLDAVDVEWTDSTSAQPRVFIGHGKSPLWRELKDFLSDRLSLQWDEFNREAVAGFTTFERLSDMLEAASFAFLVMTAEDQHSDESSHPRQNVVHELGLFQGKLGPKKAIILLEEECSEFSNIVGLSQIRFPRGNIAASFEEIRRVLEREGICET